ncbi:hypothetical protein ALC62_15912, partial [Cyphomyrmex costatus]
WCPRAPPKAGVPRGRGGDSGGERGGLQVEGKTGGDYPPHMDATPKEPPVPPTPDILSSLSRRGISDLNAVAVSPHRTFRRHQRHRISSRRYPSLLVFGGDCCASRKHQRTSSSLSPTCLDSPHFLRHTVEEPSISRRLFNVLETGDYARESFVAADSETILSVYSPTWLLNTTTLIIRQAEGEFFTHCVFTPRAFDAYFTTADQRRTGRSLRLTAVIFRVDGYIDRLRPQAPNSKIQPKTKLREQCRAALPRGLCKVTTLFTPMVVDVVVVVVVVVISNFRRAVNAGVATPSVAWRRHWTTPRVAVKCAVILRWRERRFVIVVDSCSVSSRGDNGDGDDDDDDDDGGDGSNNGDGDNDDYHDNDGIGTAAT